MANWEIIRLSKRRPERVILGLRIRLQIATDGAVTLAVQPIRLDKTARKKENKRNS